MTKIYIPIRNPKLKINNKIVKDGAIYYLDDKSVINYLTNDEYGAVSKIPDSYATLFKRESIWIVSELDGVHNKSSSVPYEFSSRVQYIFNAFRDQDFSTLSISFGILINGNVAEVIDIGQTEYHETEASKDFKCATGVKWETIKDTYQLLTRACNKYKKLYLTINKFNSSLGRKKDEDKIIDLTISLESTVQDDKSELSFKFALLNTYASGITNLADRLKTYEMLKSLYNTRSTIVHGGKDEQKTKELIEKTAGQIEEIESLTVRVITQIAFFLENNDAKLWTSFVIDNVISGNINISEKITEAATNESN